ncbi:MAG: glycosyltransferase family 9 protein [Deferribacterales bacterium]
MKIAVLKSGAIGDLILITPALTALRHFYPDADIDVLCPAEYSYVLARNPHITNIRTFSMTRIHSPYARFPETVRIISMLRGYDASVTLNTDRRWQTLARLAGIKKRADIKPEGHRADDCVRAVSELTGAPAYRTGYVFVPETSDIALPAEKYIAIAPGGGHNIKMSSPQKIWDKYPELINRILQNTGFSVVLLGDKHDSLPVIGSRIYDMTGRTTLSDCHRLIKNAERFIGNDSGLMHLAACTGTPITAIFGATNPAHTAPESAVVISSSLPCSPCETKGRFLCSENRCMRAVSVDDVFLILSN